MTARILLSLICLLAAWPATAATLESLVMPGPVIEGHADIEDDCRACHDPFDAAKQRGLCLECHEPVAADIAVGHGFHGRHPDAGSVPCKSCHTEHQGRAADITGLQPDLFDHDATDFPLTGAHAELICSSCHETGARHADAPGSCSACHEAKDPHRGQLGADCGTCHSPAGWDQTEFDHATTAFPLTGGHAQLQCASCHADARFETAGTQCIDCHRLDDTHAGNRGSACESCHTTETWHAEFDHAAATGFALQGAHQSLECNNCHVSEPEYEGLAADCGSCHSGDDAHLGRNGTACGDCHGQNSWKASFDHRAETGYELAGAHRTLTCTACHKGSLSDPLPTDCVGCHDAENPHGESLAACTDCHVQADWTDTRRFQHDSTDFALVGMHRATSCEQCHATLAFAPLTGECTECHAAEDVHANAFGPACENCHNPVGWDYWSFDHGRQTDFTLTGAHEELACDACHRTDAAAAQLATACVSCHRTDDVHEGNFGPQCDTCHDTGSFANPVIPR